MRLHHLNCGTFCPFGGGLFDGFSHGLRGRLVCHCWLIETDRHGLVLVDTGLGTRDVTKPYPRLSRLYTRALLNARLDGVETAVSQVRNLGFAPDDVRHIVLTHLDFDHAGGLEDFPGATVHLMSEELEAAKHRRGFVATRRYRPLQWDEGVSWRPYRAGGEPWFGFEAVRGLEGLPPEILLVPLCGHTLGHAGVAVQGPDGWMLHAGDAYFYREEVRRPERRCTPGLRFYQWLMEVDREARLTNQQRLRELSLDASAGVKITCAHDAVELESAAGGAPL
ncbi:MAG TPA: MBL fold metallo-hydrolase [Caulobacteraceae bacterium]|jgi:glyoxylase-like metal-dependent hydrolase (beta-lactamase superfamily II)